MKQAFNAAFAPLPQTLSHDPGPRPDYYGWHPYADSVAVMGEFNFFMGNAIKYIWRAGRKDPEATVDDIRKAMQNLKFEIDRLERKENRERTRG